MLHDVLDSRTMGISLFKAKGALQPFLKAVAACFTLGTGNSLGPEGPSVEIGASIAKGVDALLDRNSKRKLSFVAAGSAAGISAGFNAAIAGCFFAVESILWPSPADSSKSLTNTTSMVMLSAVTASVLSEIGLGSEPTFKVVEYDFRSPSGWHGCDSCRGFSSWITSGKPRKRKASYSKKLKLGNTDITKTEKASSATGPGVMENSLCLYDSNIETVEFEKRISVSQAMRTRYVTILMSTLLTEAISLMLDEKQSCAMIVDNESILIGLITLDDIQKFIESTKIRSQRTKGFVVSEICSLDDKNCRVSGTATPSMNLFSARMIMTRNGISQLPVVSELVKDHKGHLVGLLDKRCISLACSAVAAKECLTWFTTVECSSTE